MSSHYNPDTNLICLLRTLVSPRSSAHGAQDVFRGAGHDQVRSSLHPDFHSVAGASSHLTPFKSPIFCIQTMALCLCFCVLNRHRYFCPSRHTLISLRLCNGWTIEADQTARNLRSGVHCGRFEPLRLYVGQRRYNSVYNQLDRTRLVPDRLSQ